MLQEAKSLTIRPVGVVMVLFPDVKLDRVIDLAVVPETILDEAESVIERSKTRRMRITALAMPRNSFDQTRSVVNQLVVVRR
jgi:hypothetical protein